MMKNKRILVLPKFFEEIQEGGPNAIVRLMFKSNSKDFFYLKEEKREIIKGFHLLQLLRKCELFNRNPFFNLLLLYLRIKHIKRELNNIIPKYEFIISHCPIYSFVSLKYFPNKKLSLLSVYHCQGSLYSEYTDLLQIKPSFILKMFLNKIERHIFKSSNYIGFPSNGAIEALINTHKEIESIIEEKIKQNRCFVFYNGIDTKEKPTYNPLLQNKIKKDCYNFITISQLTKAKGIDRIPDFLSSLKKNKIKFNWILIGDGLMKDEILRKIKKNNLVEETNLFTQKFPHSDILGILEKTDFYIIFHRLSIFDLAIIEAMFMKNIPILSNIGGNKEIIINNNGLLLDNFNDASIFINFIKKNDIKKIKNLNKKIVIKKFSQKEFIKRYKDFAENFFE